MSLLPEEAVQRNIWEKLLEMVTGVNPGAIMAVVTAAACFVGVAVIKLPGRTWKLCRWALSILGAGLFITAFDLMDVERSLGSSRIEPSRIDNIVSAAVMILSIYAYVRICREATEKVTARRLALTLMLGSAGVGLQATYFSWPSATLNVIVVAVSAAWVLVGASAIASLTIDHATGKIS